MARITLTSHWKFLRLGRVLESRALARGVLETLWEPCWQAGDPYLGTSDDIEALCEWHGKPGALTQALLTVGGTKGAGFIELYEGTVRDTSEPHYQVHDFFEHCPDYVRVRRNAENGAYPMQCVTCGEEFFATHPRSRFCKQACRQAAYRQSVTHGVTHALRSDARLIKAKQSKPKQVRTVVGGSATTLTRVAPAAEMPGLEMPDDVTLDDDAQLDDDITPDADVERKPKKLERVNGRRKREKAKPPVDTSAIVLTFPVDGEPGPVWHLREAQVARWQKLYPNLDVLAEARQALAWIESSTARQKTYGGMTTCLVRWFNRSMDNPRSRGPTLVTGSLKTAGNQAALEEFLRRRGHGMD